MLDALTNRTRGTSAALLLEAQHDAGVGHERRSAAEPSPLWLSASYAINVLPLKAEIKHSVPCSPSRNCPFELEITFCVRGVISPLLANVYLHYVFDLWVEAWRRKAASGEMVFVRYADDLVVGFERREDAELFLRQFEKRLAEFALALHPEKTRLIEFGRFAQGARQKRGEGKPETFTFLGFTHYCATNSKGHFVVRRETVPERMRATLQAIKAKLRQRMHEPVNQVGAWLKRVVSGYYRYHAVPENGRALRRFRDRLCDMWRSMLGRRSQRSRPSWKRIRSTFERWIPRSRVLHPYPDARFDATHPR